MIGTSTASAQEEARPFEPEGPLVVRAEALPDEEVRIPEKFPVPAPEHVPDAAVESSAGSAGEEEGKTVKKVRRLWWRKRAGRTRSAAGGGSGGEGGETP